MFTVCLLAFAATAVAGSVEGSPIPGFTNVALNKMFQSWNRLLEPLRVIGNVNYVRASAVSSWLVTSPDMQSKPE